MCMKRVGFVGGGVCVVCAGDGPFGCLVWFLLYVISG